MKTCIFFVLTKLTNVTDGQTPHDGIGRACIASRGKKLLCVVGYYGDGFLADAVSANDGRSGRS